MRLQIAAFTLMLSGCATTYQAPTAIEQEHAKPNPHPSTEQALIKAKQVLALAGYDISSSDPASGVLTTAPKNTRLALTDADCGSTMGINYLRDKRTHSTVAFNVIASEERIQVKARITSEYKPGSAAQDITLQCVSLGTLESELLQKL
jgi:hypothetical protein